VRCGIRVFVEVVAKMTRLLLKTTIPYTPDDWHIGRFSLLAQRLRDDGHDVTARDRIEDEHGDDVDFIRLAEGEWRQLWLFAVDMTGALTRTDSDNIRRFQALGGGAMLTRDHQDLGSCLVRLGLVGAAHNFHSVNSETDEARRQRDDPYTHDISWPNYHSGANGDVQEISIAGPPHPILLRTSTPEGLIRYLPAHPHEGAVSVPVGAESIARVIAFGKSKVTGRTFNLAIVFDAHEEDGQRLGRAFAASTFHHFCDYNLDPASGCPSFVSERPGDEIRRNAEARKDVLTYFSNIARWLSVERQAVA
jgi:hypothetical protein